MLNTNLAGIGRTENDSTGIEYNRIDYAGIEVSAEELIVALRREGKLKGLKSFPNSPGGHKAIVRYLARPGRQVRVCLESTGVYGLDLALALHAAAGIEVMVANPRAVRHFAQALLQRSKNDRLDALVILEFAARMPFQAWLATAFAGGPPFVRPGAASGGPDRAVRSGEESLARRGRHGGLARHHPPRSARQPALS
jgi:hypothetical protein